mmetsp:Transcript_3634/g.4784  ORF Transcript_3634/g.4784 Transcript_3634/m.4784 type:complete len:259 (+) Transcript_3634:11-787(+)
MISRSQSFLTPLLRKQQNVTSSYTSYSIRRRMKSDISITTKGSGNGSSRSNDTQSLSQHVKDISVLFGIEHQKSMEISKLLSLEARNELSHIKNKIVDCKKLSSATAETAASTVKIMEPPMKELRNHAFTQGIPFIGFGIMDNAILIYAGDYIDTHLGVVLGISTLCAAAIGNIISDIAGVGLSTYVEDFCWRRLNLPKVNISSAQRNLRSVRFAGQFGNAVGITIGCIIGMFPLLLIDHDEDALKKDDKKELIENSK